MLKTPPFPIDLVYTWVDGRDKNWKKEFFEAKKELQIKISESDFLNRFVDIEDLRYSIRSAEENIPWIRYIFIVTWGGQTPKWINLTNPRLKMVSQSEIFPKSVKLPTFNSKSIDFSLYKIPGLSEHFIYSNDDMYFSQPLEFTDFFTIEGKPIIYSNQNNWTSLEHKIQRFERSYEKKKNDGTLFMISMLFSVYSFRNKFHKVATYEYSHIPTPFTKKICEEVYLNFKEEIDETFTHRFRYRYDFQMQTITIQYGLCSNQSIAKPKTNDLALFIVGSQTNRNYRRLKRISQNLPKMLSINIDDKSCRQRIKAFLDFIFDQPSSFELEDDLPIVDEKLRKSFERFKIVDSSDVLALLSYLFNEFKKFVFEFVKSLMNKRKRYKTN